MSSVFKHSLIFDLMSKYQKQTKVLIPVMLTKEASVHLSIFVPQSLSRPEWESFQFGPHQRVRVTLQTYSKTLELQSCFLVIYI